MNLADTIISAWASFVAGMITATFPTAAVAWLQGMGSLLSPGQSTVVAWAQEVDVFAPLHEAGGMFVTYIGVKFTMIWWRAHHWGYRNVRGN